MIERAEGRHGIGNGFDSVCDVGNGVDRQRVDAVDDDRKMLVC